MLGSGEESKRDKLEFLQRIYHLSLFNLIQFII